MTRFLSVYNETSKSNFQFENSLKNEMKLYLPFCALSKEVRKFSAQFCMVSTKDLRKETISTVIKRVTKFDVGHLFALSSFCFIN